MLKKTINLSLNKEFLLIIPPEVANGIVEERLLKTVVHYVLEEIAFVTLSVTHLAENLTVAAYDTLDCIV